MLKLTFMLTLACINLTFIKPTFSQAKIESHIFSKDNPINGAISIRLADGWSTYWKFPGPNGFTPNIKVLHRENLKSFNISWPFPKKLGPKNFTYLGYDNDLLLPVELKKLDENKNVALLLDISYGICKSVCVVQSKTLTISDKDDIDYLILNKLLKSNNRITMATVFGSSNKCRLEKLTDTQYKVVVENFLMRNSRSITSVLVDYEGSSWTIEAQSFYPRLGRVEALLKLKEATKSKLDLENVSLLYLDNLIAKKTVACVS
ncbi:protein-disulfide reductase DsbD family protein [Paracoccaceae bacterium]|nr:protein-disulfide reductase DsbD family protein [Paracoccaceae bacterium]